MTWLRLFFGLVNNISLDKKVAISNVERSCKQKKQLVKLSSFGVIYFEKLSYQHPRVQIMSKW